MELNFCADCLDFAVFRRGFGGWETTAAKFLEVANLPAFLAATKVFSGRRWQFGGTSREQSDIATITLIVVSAAQWALFSLLLSIRTGRRRAA
jgi:hypothetical protein